MIDLAIGVVIGGAFGTIVTSLVNDVLMPPIGLLLGKVDFSKLYINLSKTKYPSLADAQAAGAPTINYGLFINSLISFLIVAIVIFFIIKLINKLSAEKKEKAPATRECPFCLSQIPLKASRCPSCTSEVDPV